METGLRGAFCSLDWDRSTQKTCVDAGLAVAYTSSSKGVVFRSDKSAITVDIHEAATHFSQLIERVTSGEEIIIAQSGKPVARLVAIEEDPPQRVPGSAAEQVELFGQRLARRWGE